MDVVCTKEQKRRDGGRCTESTNVDEEVKVVIDSAGGDRRIHNNPLALFRRDDCQSSFRQLFRNQR